MKGRKHRELQPSELIQQAELLDPVGPVVKEGDVPKTDPGITLFPIPALALPVVTKSDFLCPQSHLERLTQLLPQVDKILVVGWRGAERHFLKLLKEGLTKRVKVLSVCGNPEWSKQTNQRIQDSGVAGEFFEGSAGFTDLLLNDEDEAFIRG